MANYDVETRIPDVLVHITYPDNKTKNITITGYAIHKRPRCKIDGMKDCRKLAKTKDDISVIVDRVVNAIVDKYQNKDKKVVMMNSFNIIDANTRIGKTFLNLKVSNRCFYNDWRETTQHSYMVFYEKEVIPEIQWCNASEDFGKVEFYDLVKKLAQKTFKNGNFEGESLQEAEEKVTRKLNYAYPIFSEMRYMDPSIPDLFLRDEETMLTKRTQKEQKKYLPPKIHKSFRQLLEQDLERKPQLVRAAILMENCALRTNESAGWTQDLGEEFDNHLIIWVLIQGKGNEQTKILKSHKGYRFVITDDWGYVMIKRCNKLIDDNKNVTPTTDNQVCDYVKDKLIEAGLTKEYVSLAASELQQTQLQGKNKGIDVAAYILRRNRANIWRNYCGYSQKELDYSLGHVSTINNKMKEDMWRIDTRLTLSDKNRRFILNPEVSQSPKYQSIDVSKFESRTIIPFTEYRFINKGNKPIHIKIHAVTAEPGEAIELIHNERTNSSFITNNAIKTTSSKRACTEIIGNVEDELK
ncbi:MAG: hypothetical protein MJ244_02405 [Clostridia bacterium]|nr:hypothetical protein [Clostridia bacterium]